MHKTAKPKAMAELNHKAQIMANRTRKVYVIIEEPDGFTMAESLEWYKATGNNGKIVKYIRPAKRP